MATRPCYTIHFLHIVLSYIFLYDLILSYIYICVFTLIIELAFTTDSKENLIMFVIPYIFILYFSYTIISYEFHILCFSYTVISYYLSYTFRVIETLFLELVYLSYTFLFHILYLFIYFSCTILCTFHILSSCTLLLVLVIVYYHRITVLCFSYHVIYYIHFICIYLSFSFRFHVCKYLRSGYGK